MKFLGREGETIISRTMLKRIISRGGDSPRYATVIPIKRLIEFAVAPANPPDVLQVSLPTRRMLPRVGHHFAIATAFAFGYPVGLFLPFERKLVEVCVGVPLRKFGL